MESVKLEMQFGKRTIEDFSRTGPPKDQDKDRDPTGKDKDKNHQTSSMLIIHIHNIFIFELFF